MQQINLAAIGEAARALTRLDGERQLNQLRRLCEEGGVWTIPPDGSAYRPALYEVSLYGVAALSDDITTLPRNWIRAAHNILHAGKEHENAHDND